MSTCRRVVLYMASSTMIFNRDAVSCQLAGFFFEDKDDRVLRYSRYLLVMALKNPRSMFVSWSHDYGAATEILV